jgi:hypothetical protein
MDEERIKQAVLSVMERTDFAQKLATAVEALAPLPSPPGRGAGGEGHAASQAHAPTPGTQKLLTRIVLGDILDDTILGARPQDRTFPLRLLFSELGTLLAHEGDDGPQAHAAEQAFTLASGLNFFFRAPMDSEAKIRVGLEVSRQLYTLAHDAKMDPDLIAKAAPLLATIMSTELERVRFESIDHTKVYDSQVHERTSASDPTGSRILRPASFLCRVSTNNAVKAKAQVVT